MNFDGDAFISDAHLDNVELVEGRKGWVANLHRALEVRGGQILGKSPHIWRDPKLSGNDLYRVRASSDRRRLVQGHLPGRIPGRGRTIAAGHVIVLFHFIEDSCARDAAQHD
jgi:hypothetical protein